MTDENQSQRPKIDNLELNKETLQDLTESEQEAGEGGAFPTLRCQSVAFSCSPVTDCCLATRQNPATC